MSVAWEKSKFKCGFHSMIFIFIYLYLGEEKCRKLKSNQVSRRQKIGKSQMIIIKQQQKQQNSDVGFQNKI